MTTIEPVAELDARFSSPEATPLPWETASALLTQAEVYWLTTVRPDGRPHVTPLLAVWQDEALYFCTGPTERKADNLAHNAHCILTTGCNTFAEGVDLVVEGDAKQINDEAVLQRLADQWATKYDWHFDVRDGAFYGDGGRADVYEVRPAKVLGFGKGETFSQTRWRF
jgi:general stress protein 26